MTAYHDAYFNLLLGDLGKYLHIPDLAFGEDGFCTLKFDDVVLSIVINSDAHLLLIATVTALPVQYPPQLMEYLLGVNGYWQPGSAVLSLQQASRTLVLHELIDRQDVTFPTLIERMEAMIGQAEDVAVAVAEALAAPQVACS